MPPYRPEIHINDQKKKEFKDTDFFSFDAQGNTHESSQKGERVLHVQFAHPQASSGTPSLGVTKTNVITPGFSAGQRSLDSTVINKNLTQ